MAQALLTILLELSAGGAFALALVSRGPAPAFYRLTGGLLVVSGALALTGLMTATARGVTMAFLLVFTAAIFSAGRPWVGRLLIAATGLGAMSLAAAALGRGLAFPALSLLSMLLSAVMLGGAVVGMLLGHRYLMEPGLPVRLIRRIGNVFLAAAVAQASFPAVEAIWQVLVSGAGAAEQMLQALGPVAFAATARLLVGSLGTLTVALVIQYNLRDAKVRSATGFFYVAILTVALGEIAGHFVAATTAFPF